MTDYVVKRRRLDLAGRYAAGVAALAIVLTVSGAYDTEDLSIAHRLGLFAVIGALLVGQSAWMIGRFERVFGTGAGGMMLTALSTIGLAVLWHEGFSIRGLLQRRADSVSVS